MTATKPHTSEPWVEIIRSRVGTMRFGSVQLTIHDGRVTQVEATEKVRLQAGQDDARDSRTNNSHDARKENAQ
jgi:hypothetical protein